MSASGLLKTTPRNWRLELSQVLVPLRIGLSFKEVRPNAGSAKPNTPVRIRKFERPGVIKIGLL